ncbi:unnamed protein product [Urochloa humidicola]
MGNDSAAPHAAAGDGVAWPPSPRAPEIRAPPPAEVPVPPPAAEAAPTPLRVYSRQRRRARAPPSSPAEGAPQCSSSPSRCLSKIRKPVDTLLPLPDIQKRRKKAPPPGSLPRRSRRVAGAKPCSPGPVISDAQKRVMRQLGFEEKEVIDPSAQDTYSKLFKPPHSESNVAALAAIFGWSVGEGEQVRSVEVLAGL